MIVARAAGFFGQRFGSAPAIIGVAPGRVNLIGEHVDYADGFVLPMAIERATAVAIRPTAGESTLASDGFARAWKGDLRRAHAPIREADLAWANYVLGPIAELAALGTPITNVECAIVSDVPAGGGVSSSAALEVATARAMAELAGSAIGGLDIARLCQRAEHHYAGTPCGIMDMTVSANAKAGNALLIDCRTLELRDVPLPPRVEVLVIDSGVRHRLSDGGYASRRRAVEEAARSMGIAALRDATAEELERTPLDAVTRRRARHVVGEIARALAGAEALAAGDAVRFGELMRASHRSLRDDFEVSVDEIDCIVDAANEAVGTFGARLTGGGFGGCAVALVERGSAESVLAAVGDRFARRFGRGVSAFVTGAAAGASVLRWDASGQSGRGAVGR